MYNGIQFVFPEDALQDITLDHLMQNILKTPPHVNVSLSYVYPDKGTIHAETHLILKDYWHDRWGKFHASLSDRDRTLLQERMTTFPICSHPHCFEIVAAAAPAYKEKNILLMDRNGENDVHEIFLCCLSHIAPAHHQLLKTIEMIDLTNNPQADLQKHIAVWQSGKNWRSQFIWDKIEGDCESGYSTVTLGSPHYGPFSTKEKAREYARYSRA